MQEHDKNLYNYRKRTRMHWMRELYFIVGDFLSSALAGGLTAMATFFIVNPEWNMVMAMVVGMFVGMVVVCLIIMVFAPLLGMFEIMIPTMITGMTGGMASGMIASAYFLPLNPVFYFGTCLGVLVCAWVWFLIKKNRGEVC